LLNLWLNLPVHTSASIVIDLPSHLPVFSVLLSYVLMRYFWVSDIMIVGRTSYNKLLQPVVSQCGLPYA